MIPNALIYNAQLMNARPRRARKNAVEDSGQTTKVAADCSGVRTPCLYRLEVTQ